MTVYYERRNVQAAKGVAKQALEERNIQAKNRLEAARQELAALQEELGPSLAKRRDLQNEIDELEKSVAVNQALAAKLDGVKVSVPGETSCVL